MLHFRQSTRKTLSLSFSPHITVPLCSLLPAVASSHADPLTRHQSFCVLSLLIVASKPQLRFRSTRDSEFPQMRVASVGLVKEALYRSLRVRTISSWLLCFCAVLGPFSDLILPISSSLQIWISRNSWALETVGIFVSIMSFFWGKRAIWCVTLLPYSVIPYCIQNFWFVSHRLVFGIPVFLKLLIRTFSFLLLDPLVYI